MSIHTTEFEGWVSLLYKQYKWYKTTANPVPPAAVNAEMATIAAALAADTTKHDKTIEAPAAALQIHHEKQTPFTNDVNVLINRGKAGNLSNASMIAAMDAIVGVVSKPGLVTAPYAHAAATPPIVGTVCNCTTGSWVGSPTSYAYQWQTNGANSTGAGATTNAYTAVAADIGGKHLTCIVTATNAQGSTAAPPSNSIAT
jgi:hypothetical protein